MGGFRRLYFWIVGVIFKVDGHLHGVAVCSLSIVHACSFIRVRYITNNHINVNTAIMILWQLSALGGMPHPNKPITNIHPPSFFHHLSCTWGHRGAYPRYLRAKAGYNLDKSPIHCKAKNKDKQPNSHLTI